MNFDSRRPHECSRYDSIVLDLLPFGNVLEMSLKNLMYGLIYAFHFDAAETWRMESKGPS